jgi:hypothetical protein
MAAFDYALRGTTNWRLRPLSETNELTPDHTQLEPKSKTRSRVSNGSALLPGVDGRSSWCRRARDLIDRHLLDLGGADAVSEAERSIVRRASVLTTELEQLEARFALSGQASSDDLDLYQRCANSLRRLLESVGLERRAKLVAAPTLEQIAADIEAGREDAAA